MNRFIAVPPVGNASWVNVGVSVQEFAPVSALPSPTNSHLPAATGGNDNGPVVALPTIPELPEMMSKQGVAVSANVP